MGTRAGRAVILIIDDDPGVRGMFSNILESEGYCPIPAVTAEEALSLMAYGLLPDAILLDLRMPGMGGLGFLLQIRATPLYADLPVAVVTGDIFNQVAGGAVAALGATLCHKPVNISEILDLTARLVESSH